jgi:flagellin
MSDVVLSAGVRQNLLSLQNTAQLMSITQNRLATGKKVNSALDNPGNFFTSQALSDRASDLNSLLDAIGQGQKVLEAADQGITSLTKLVQSAKAVATQARQAPRPITTYGAVSQNTDISAPTNLNGTETIATVTSTIGATPSNMAAQAIALSFTSQSETLGQITGGNAGTFAGGGGTVGGGNAGNLVITVNGTDYTIAVAGGDTLNTVIANINAAVGGTSPTDLVDATPSGGKIRLTAHTADDSFSINAGSSTAATLTAIGLDAPSLVGSGTSTSLLDNIVAAGGSSGSTFTIDVNGGASAGGVTRTITFGANDGAGQVSTLADLKRELNVVGIGGGASGDVVGTTMSLNNLSGAANTLGLTVSDVGVRAALGLGAARNVGQTGGLGAGAAALSRTYNSAATLADLDPTNLLNGGNVTVTVNGSAQTVALSASDHLDTIINKLRSNATLDSNLSFTNVAGQLKIDAKSADVDFSIAAGAVATAFSGVGPAFAATYNSTSLFDLLAAKLGGANSVQGATLTFAVNDGAAQTITFGTGQNQVSTLAKLQTALSSLSGMNASLAGNTLNLQVPSSTSPTNLTVGGSNNASIASAIGLSTSKQSGATSATQDNTQRTSLQANYNDILDQIDNLVKDSSYNGINLLYSDDLKLVFNETGTSTLTIKGVKFDSAGLSLTAVNGSNGSGFQDNTIIDSTLDKLETALGSLRGQASKFGTNLTTVETRQDFTKQLINTLQTGADQLVLADTNEEGANMLALQTRQQLSTTALSLANQASQAVLRLFG